ncbi:MAG: TetR/AcrR family transcriptional regulator [Phycisphaeraceae bacterium]|nr:TetR/AcrR family transcriptional regulator [Phycisphaeraceae bacterium]
MQRFDERKKKAFKELARQAIYEATLAVIKEHGYDGLTMQRVATAAGIATGTLYNYFKNKDELLIYADKMIHLEFLEFFGELNALSVSAREKLDKWVEGIYGFAREHMQVWIIMDQANIFSKMPKQELLNNHRDFENTFVTVVQQGIKEACFRQVDPAVAGELFAMTLSGMICRKAEMGTFDADADKEKVLDFFFHYLGCADV